MIPPDELDQLRRGAHPRPWTALGCHPLPDGGARFAVWAPNARAVSVVGDWNGWDGRVDPLVNQDGSGFWSWGAARAGLGQRYKYQIHGADRHLLPLKADPFAFAAEPPPATASLVRGPGTTAWRDAEWLARREAAQRPDAPITIYEVHANSWMRDGPRGERALDWRGLAERLIPYAVGMGFTHLELLPIHEHPFTGSWGYQPVGLYAPTARYGDPDGFAAFVYTCHAAGLGLILDWVPGHFPTDAHGPARFDGTAAWEHEDPREGFHPDWNTLIYNLGRWDVANALAGNATFWVEHYHVDGLRVEAVASMLYRDYSRSAGEWVPNHHGGRENYEAIAFLRRTTDALTSPSPAPIAVAEESTAWPGVSDPVAAGGLGFSYKWNMGWMHDTLADLQEAPVHRRWHHDRVTFGLVYAWSEN